jgi:ubiquitin C-terminal hydrolase
MNNDIVFKDPKLGLCGFNNMGNTCYMNSILQLLIHSRTLINFLLCESNPFERNNSGDSVEDYKEDLTFVDLIIMDKIKAPFIIFLKECSIDRLADIIRNKFNLNSNEEVRINFDDFKSYLEKTLTIKLAEIINTLIYKGNNTITPTGFKKVIDKKIPSFRGFGQQDAHELLIGILDILIEETGVDSEPVINNVPNTIKEYLEIVKSLKNKINNISSIEEKKKYIGEYNNYKKLNWDTINKYNGLKYMTGVFGNKRKNTFDTSTTGYNPTIYNLLTFNMNIFKCIECFNTNYKFEFNTVLSLDVKPTLKECFENYILGEHIDRNCDMCSSKKAIKTKQIWRPGILMFIQLCRFNNLPNGKIWKNNHPVEIPDSIDISNYCDDTMKTEKSLTYKYKLKGISSHMGSLNGGHYVADGVSIVDNKTWYHFDDSRVGRHQTPYIDTSSAYILMYEMEFD